MNIKEELYIETKNFVEERMKTTQNLINSIQISLQSETKSSAGDKHETGRAMLQLEREKVGNQFVEIQRLQKILQRIDIKKKSELACLGSLITTDNGIYFIAIGRGVVNYNKQEYFVIAINSPIGKILLGKQKGEEVDFNGKTIKILTVS